MLATGKRNSRRGSGMGRDGASAAARYEVLERVGEGTLFVAYRVRDRSNNGILALKALKGAFNKHSRFAGALDRAAERAVGLMHPHLARVEEVGAEEGTLFIVSEWLPGPSLEAQLNYAPFNHAECLSYTRQIAEALHHLHSNGTIHGDLRPRQVLLASNDTGVTAHLKLTDLGLAEALFVAGIAPIDVLQDAAYYLAPERFDGAPPSAATDLYALGVALYRMLTGRVPFDGPSPLAIGMRHRTQTPLRPSQFNPDCSPQLEAIALRLLEKDPAARYSAAQLLRDLAFGTSQATPTQVASAPAAETTASPVAPPVVVPLPEVSSPAPFPPAPPLDDGRTNLPPVNVSAAPDDVDTPMSDEDEIPAPRARRAWTPPPVDVEGEMEEEEPDFAAEQEEKLLRRRQRRREALGAFLAAFWTIVAAGLLVGIIYGARYFWMQDMPKEVTVPKYAGLSKDDAETLLTNKGLKMRIGRWVFNRKRPAGTVLAGEPSAGKKVRVGREILVTVSSGPEPIKMYDFTELSLQRARQIMLRDGLRLGQIIEQYHDKIPRGYVCDQYPQPGEPYSRTDSISLVISKGPQPSGDVEDIAPLPPPPDPRVVPEDPATQPIAEPKEDEAPDTTLVSRTVRVRVAIPADGPRQDVQIIVRDADGEHTVYRRTHAAGDLVDETIRVTRQQGTSALVRVYVGGQLEQEKRF
ncbi:MAG: protein kinase [Armatimonadota bacterium]|nr:protein kinase [Armatimonadota bacterium]